MKKILIVLILLLVSLGAFAQTTYDFTSKYQPMFEDFAAAVATALPLNSTIGLGWSDAYIGQLFDMPPHFGAGVSVGFTGIPYTVVKPLLDDMGATADFESSQLFPFIEKLGVPFPAYTFEGRVGGFLLDFDVGFKFGFIPKEVDVTQLVPNLDLDYTLIGFDVRFPLVKEEGMAPDISIGGGYNYLRGFVALNGILGGDYTIQSVDVPGYGSYDITLTDPAISFLWESSVIDLKLQISKQLLIFTPFVGAGASLSFSGAGGGLTSSIQLSPNDITIAELNAALQALGGDTIPEVTEQGFYIKTQTPMTFTARAFGGLSIDILILRINLGAMYDFIGKNFGAEVGLRVQL
jgi:hypothetical protein